MNFKNSIDYEDFNKQDVDSCYKKIKNFQDNNEMITLNESSIQEIAQNSLQIQFLSDLEIELKALLSERVFNLPHLPQYLNKRIQPFIIFILNKILYDYRRLKLQCYLNEILFLVQKLAIKIWQTYPIQALQLLKEIHNVAAIDFYNSQIGDLQVYKSIIDQFYNERLNYGIVNQAEMYVDEQQIHNFYPLKNEILDSIQQSKSVYIFSPFQRMQIHYFYKNGGIDLLNNSFNNFTLKHLDILNIQQYFKNHVDKLFYLNNFQQLNFQQLAYKLSDEDIKNSTKETLNQLISSIPNLLPQQIFFLERQTQYTQFQMTVYLQCLRCSSLQKRIYGLQFFCDKIINPQNSQNNQMILTFLIENQVFQDLFGEKTHFELIKRSFPIVKLLYLNKSIKREELITILRLARGKHETWINSISKILQDLAEILNLEDIEIMLQNLKSNPISLDGLNFIKSLGRNQYLKVYVYKKETQIIDNKYKKQKLNPQDEHNSYEEKIIQYQEQQSFTLKIETQIVEYLLIIVQEQSKTIIGQTAFDIAIELICHQFQCLRIQYLIFAIQALNSDQAQLSIYHYFNMIQSIIQSSYPIENYRNSTEVFLWMEQKFNLKLNFLKLIKKEKLKSLKKEQSEYLQVMTLCINFYEFLHQNSKIQQYELQLLWKLLVENARCLEERDLFFDQSFRQSNLEQNAMEWLLFKIIEQQYKSQSMLRCLIKLIFHFNVLFRVMKSNTQNEYQLLESNMVGIIILWNIFHTQSDLYDQLSHFFIKLLKMQQNLQILNNLKQQYLAELFSCIQNPTSIQLVIQLLEEFEGLKLMDQQEKILITILNVCSNALNPKQQEIQLSSNLQVYQAKQIIGQKLNPWMIPEDFDIFCKGILFNDQKTLGDYNVSSKLTFQISDKQDFENGNEIPQYKDLDTDEKVKKIQDIVNIQNKQFILSVLKDKNWDVDNAIGDLLDRGEQLYIEYQQKNIKVETKKLNETSSFAFLISNQYIEQLFNLLNQENQQVNEKIWSILQMIPSNQNVYKLIESSQNDWSKLLIVDNKYRLQYHLQILKEQLSCDCAEDQDSYKTLRYNFLSKGGLQLLLNNFDHPKEIVLIILEIFQMYLNSYAINQLQDKDYMNLLKLKSTNQITSLFLTQDYLSHNEISFLQSQSQLFAQITLDIQINWENFLENLYQRIGIEQYYTMILCVLYVKPILLKQQIPINKLLLLLTNESSELRKLTAIFILTLNSIGQRFQYNLSKIFLLELIKGKIDQVEMFIVIGELIEQVDDISFLNTQDLALSILNQIKSRIIIESPFGEIEDTQLQGNLLMLKSLLKRDISLSDSLIDSEFSQYLYECLFEMHNDYTIYPIYKKNNTRRRAFDLLFELSRNQKHFFQILPLIYKYQQKAIISSNQNCDFGIKGFHGYVGLFNLGATCYINSLLQQLFMNFQFRKAILNCQILIKKDTGESVIIQNPSQLTHELIQKMNEHTLHQLQLVFIQLQESVKQYINPNQFIKTLKGFDGQQINPCIQEDCNEFFNLLTGKLESDLKHTLQHNLINQNFGGTLVNEIKSLQSDCDFQKETEEPFLTVSVEIKNKQNLFEALDLFVKSDVLDGENQYFCDEVSRKIDAEKRCYFQKLPKTFIFHLKRFEFDINTNTRSKINDFCEFPLEINMFQWTRDNIVEHRQLDNQLEFMYQLKGVLVHTGTAEGGHYFSYIKDHNNQWFEFNDKLITPFNIIKMKTECFGGNSNNDQWGQQYSKNAYMLFYEKIKLQENQEKQDAYINKQKQKDQIEIENLEQEQCSKWDDTENNNEVYLRNDVIRQNTLQLVNKYLNDREYMEFIQRLVQFWMENIELQSNFEMLQFLTVYTFKLYLQEKDQKQLQKNIRILNNSYNKDSLACNWLLNYLRNNIQILIEFLVESQIIESAQLLNLVIEQARKVDESNVTKFFQFYLSELLPIIRKNFKKGVYYLEVIIYNLESDTDLLKQIQNDGYFKQFYKILKEKVQLLQDNNYLKIVLINDEYLILICEILVKIVVSCRTIGIEQNQGLGDCPTYKQKGTLNLNIDQAWIEELFYLHDFRRYILSMVQHQNKLIQMIKHICWNDYNISQKVIQQIVLQILDDNNKWQQLEQITKIFEEILNINDGLQEFRIRLIFQYESNMESSIRGTTIMRTILKDDLNYSIGIICIIAELGCRVIGFYEYLNQNKGDYEYLYYKLQENLDFQHLFQQPILKIQQAIKQLQSIFNLEIQMNFDRDNNQIQVDKVDDQIQLDRNNSQIQLLRYNSLMSNDNDQHKSDQLYQDNDENNEIF